MTRAEHLAWCKQRALEYLERDDLHNALASMDSDMRKHAETNMPVEMAMIGMHEANQRNADGLRKWIEGFN